MKYSILQIFIILFITTVCYGQSSTNSKLKASSPAAFIENKGQIIDKNNKPNPVVLYLLNTPGMNVQLRRGGFSYDLYQATGSWPLAAGSENTILDSVSKSRKPEARSRNFHRANFS